MHCIGKYIWHENFKFLVTDTSRKLREEFARCCFETLLRFSFLGPKGNPNLFIQSPNNNNNNLNEIGLVNKLAVTSLLQRFHDVVTKYVEDEKLSGKCPLPRHRMGEISFVLQALATLASSLKKIPPETGLWIWFLRRLIKQMISLQLKKEFGISWSPCIHTLSIALCRIALKWIDHCEKFFTNTKTCYRLHIINRN